MPGNWLNQFIERSQGETVRSKGARLGKFSEAPMQTTTLDLHGLIAKDALEVVGRKINRALAAGVKELRILHPAGDRKLRRALHQFLSEQPEVKKVDATDDMPGVTLVTLHD